MTWKRWTDVPLILYTEDAAILFRKHPETIKRWCKSGRLPATHLGREWAIARDKVMELLGITDLDAAVGLPESEAGSDDS